MGYLDDINFEITQDGSVGLYEKKIGDIFHSRTGAYKEANDKFINPIVNILPQFSNDINILDICYGIGYNTKAALTNFKNYNLKIDALEYNKHFVYLSPFINDGIDNVELSQFILSEIYNFCEKKEELAAVLADMSTSRYDKYICALTRRFIERFNSDGYIYNPNDVQQTLLHNIYYKYISDSMKTYEKPNIYKKSKINCFFGDARKSIFNTNNLYDIVFLDAFSPQKDPTLWTIDFLSVIKSKMKQNSILVSYSKSAPFRSALLELGFYVGKTILDNSDMGTVASLNSSFIYNKLGKTDLDVIETRSGIPYRDINLNLPSSSIIINRSIEGAASDRISRTQYIKQYL